MKANVYILLIPLLILLTSCDKVDDITYLTPIPEATLSAYRDDIPIENKLQAAIGAQAFLRTTRLDYEEDPKIISVEEITLEEAHRRVRDSQSGNYNYEDRPGNTKVWLVMLEGQWRIIPPDGEYTSEPYSRGCAYVILDRNGRSEMSTMRCTE